MGWTLAGLVVLSSEQLKGFVTNNLINAIVTLFLLTAGSSAVLGLITGKGLKILFRNMQ